MKAVGWLTERVKEYPVLIRPEMERTAKGKYHTILVAMLRRWRLGQASFLADPL
ncbi:MAG: hypothetical protein ABR985_09985 [Methanotrichaceae archaeon]